MKTSSVPLQHSLLSLALMAAFAAPSAYAATITVNTNADTAGGMSCSLRDAVLSVNAGSNQGGCLADESTNLYGAIDTINLPADTYRLTLAGLDETPSTLDSAATVINVPNASVGDLDLLKSVRIVGAGSGTTRIERDPLETVPANTDRIFHIYTTDVATTSVDVVIQGVTLASGKVFEVDLGVDPVDSNFHWWFRRAGGALALGAAANVVKIDETISSTDNAVNGDGKGGGSTGEETAVAYTLALSDVVVKDSSAQGDGGGLYLADQTTATNLVVQANTSTTNGGGIYNEALTQIATSTIVNNISEGGGGLFVTGASPISISRSTFSGNRAVGGGAVSGRAGVTINMENSTLSGNLGQDVGAGFYHNGPANLRFVTIANNVAGADSKDAGAGINTFKSGSSLTKVQNILLAGNMKGWVPVDYKTDPFPDTSLLTRANCGGTGGTAKVDSLGSNLSSDTTCTVILDQIASDKNNVDPKIGALANNGGTTLTHALLTGSPALAAGTAAVTLPWTVAVTVDQLGTTRNTTPDIGAYEVFTVPPVTPPSSGGGGGGCTVNPSAQFDGVLLGLLAAALGGLMLRRWRSGARN